MRKIEEDDIDSELSEDLKDDQLIGLHRYNRARRTTKNSKITAQMEALYKSALLDSFFGRFQEASKKLKHYIENYPESSEAYHTLGTMYEELNEDKNAAQYYALSAYLSPPNIQKWKNAAQKSFNIGLYSQAAYCYGRALKIQNYNTQIMQKRAKSFELSNQYKKAIQTYKKILSITFSLPVLKSYARLRFQRQQYQISRQILQTYQKHQTDPNISYMICQTYLKQNKMNQLLEYMEKFVEINKKQGQQYGIQSLFIEFVILLYLAMVKLGKTQYKPLNVTANQIKKVLIESYDEEQYVKQYQMLISYLKSDDQNCFDILQALIKHKPHQTVENYLILTQFLKKRAKYQQAIRLLKQGLQIHKNSLQLISQLNHIKVISGDRINGKKNDKRKNGFGAMNVGVSKGYNNTQQINEDIFYSDQDDQDGFGITAPVKERQTKAVKDPSSIHQNIFNQKKPIQTQDPQMIRRLLQNSKQTLYQIINHSSIQLMAHSYKQVQSCVNLLINLSQVPKNMEQQEKQGLFKKNHRRRRYFTSKQQNRQDIINKNIQTILTILEHIVEIQQFNKSRCLAQILSKAYFFKWQNRSPELRKLKKLIFQMGLLSCLILEKYETAVYFVRYLAHKQPDNSFYLLIVNYLIHNSNTKICMSTLLGKYLQKNSLDSRNVSMSEQRRISVNNKQKNSQKQQNFFQDAQQFQNVSDNALSYPRKMSNFSNISDIFRDNIKLNYLFGIQYMQTGCFDLALSSFLKIINLCEGQLKKTVWLCLCSCFLQMGSSRTCHTKLSYTNRSTYCFWQYVNSAEDNLQKGFNKGRFFAQLKLNSKAIQQYNKILQSQVTLQSQKQIQMKSAFNLMCIYKQIQDWGMVNKLSQKYFNLKDQNSYRNNKQQEQSQYEIQVE